jgi:GH15 family glucan-1,4-alpha-glucosidase
VVAAPTTSLPEELGGVRNWDYRYCWLRDAAYTLSALVVGGYTAEAAAWRNWLLRAVAGDPRQLQVLYGVRGERRLEERDLPWLSGYEGSEPVRIGNAAVTQLQLDVYGEVMDAMYLSRRAGIPPDEAAWHLECALLGALEQLWSQPDAGIWEIRGPLRHFTHSKVMAWVAFDRGIRSVEEFNLDGPVDRWRRIRQQIADLVWREGFSQRRGSFVQYFGSDEVDGSLLLLSLVGFVRADDPRMIGTVKAVQHDLLYDGFVRRYRPRHELEGVPGDEGVFLACSCWLVANLALQGHHSDAERLFERLLSVANDVGLLAEEYEPRLQRQLGNFPQALSHVMLIVAARYLTHPPRDPGTRHLT